MLTTEPQPQAQDGCTWLYRWKDGFAASVTGSDHKNVVKDDWNCCETKTPVTQPQAEIEPSDWLAHCNLTGVVPNLPLVTERGPISFWPLASSTLPLRYFFNMILAEHKRPVLVINDVCALLPFRFLSYAFLCPIMSTIRCCEIDKGRASVAAVCRIPSNRISSKTVTMSSFFKIFQIR